MNKRTLFPPPALLLVLFCAAGAAAQPEVVDRIVAVVGKEPITLSDLQAQTQLYAYANHLDPSASGLQEQVLDAMINEKLILARAVEDTNINITEDQVTSQLDALVAQRVREFGSEKALEDRYGMPIAKIKREFRDETRKQLLIQALQQSKFGDLEPSRREVEEFYTQFKDSLPNVKEELEVYHIYRVPGVGDRAKEELRGRLRKILDSIKAGGDFADFAARYSEDPATAQHGGDLGFVRRGEFFKEFEEAVFALKEKELSGVVETPLGMHIIQLLERRGEQVHPRHILLKFRNDAAAVDSTTAFLRALRDSVVRGGRSFTELAKKYSEDKESAPLGGFLGRLPVTQFDPALVKTVAGLKEGEISDPVAFTTEKSTGYQIVFLAKRVPEHAMRLPDDYKYVEQLATSYKRTTEYQRWLQQLRTEVYWDKRY